ncbi:MAG: hypothetical protein IKO02_01145, partial [Lentisphaeria bacterium]|nr:hypothetical protein [Lentisphaeria bacterium]
MSNDLASRSLAYHANPQPGKLKILPSKPCTTQDDLSLAYTPGVAVPCTEIHDHPEKIWEYTGRGNTVAVVSDGTAVLGLGNIGPEAGLPVMEVFLLMIIFIQKFVILVFQDKIFKIKSS